MQPSPELKAPSFTVFVMWAGSLFNGIISLPTDIPLVALTNSKTSSATRIQCKHAVVFNSSKFLLIQQKELQSLLFKDNRNVYSVLYVNTHTKKAIVQEDIQFPRKLT